MTTTRVVTGLTVEYKRVRLPPGSTIGDPVCVTDPEDCCSEGSGSGSGSGSGVIDDPVEVECCPNPVPRHLCARIAVGSEHSVMAHLEYQDAEQAWQYMGPGGITGEFAPLLNGKDGLSLECIGSGYWRLKAYQRSAPETYELYDDILTSDCDPLDLSFPAPSGTGLAAVDIFEPGQGGTPYGNSDSDCGSAPDGSSFVPTGCCPSGTGLSLLVEADSAPDRTAHYTATYGLPVSYTWSANAGTDWDPYNEINIYCAGGTTWTLVLRDPIAPDELTFTATSATCYVPGVSVFSLTFEGTPHGDILVTNA